MIRKMRTSPLVISIVGLLFLFCYRSFAGLRASDETPEEIAARNTHMCGELIEKLQSLATLGKAKLVSPPSARADISEIKEQVAKGEELETVLNTFETPENLRRFFEPATGLFRYHNPTPYRLAVENGDAKLSAIRIHWWNRRREVPNFGWENRHHAIEANLRNNISQDYLTQLAKLLHYRPGIDLWITGPENDPEFMSGIANLPKAIRRRIKLVDSYSLTYWAQDGSKPLDEPSTTLLPRGMGNRAAQNYANSVHDAVKKGLMKSKQSVFDFQGGDLSVGAQHLFVGSDVVKWNQDRLKISRLEVLAALSSEFGQPVKEIGYFNSAGEPMQLDLHNDMWMAPVRDRVEGPEKILIGSVRKAAELLLEETSSSEKRRQPPGNLFSLNGRATRPERWISNYLYRNDLSQLSERQHELDQAGDQLRALGYELVYLPDFSWHPIIGEASKRPEIYGYTNSVFSGDLALLPEMGVRKWDNYVKGVLGAMGYESLMFPVAQKSVCQEGGVRCLSETFRRPKR